MAAAATAPRIKPSSPAVQKAFAIIELFASDNRPYTLSEISRRLQLPVSTTSALLKTMQQCGYVTRTDKGFSLSTKLLTEASKALNQMELHKIAEAELSRLAHSTGLTAILLVRDRDQVVCIHKVDSVSDIRIASFIGRRFHMHFTCTGKAVLAHLPEEEAMNILASSGLPRNTQNTITSIDDLKKEFQRIRARGYAIDDEEFATHIRGVGAAIFDHRGYPIGGVAVAGGADEVAVNMTNIIENVVATALTVSQKLGHTVNFTGRPAASAGISLALPRNKRLPREVRLKSRRSRPVRT